MNQRERGRDGEKREEGEKEGGKREVERKRGENTNISQFQAQIRNRDFVRIQPCPEVQFATGQ